MHILKMHKYRWEQNLSRGAERHKIDFKKTGYLVYMTLVACGTIRGLVEIWMSDLESVPLPVSVQYVLAFAYILSYLVYCPYKDPDC